MKKWYAVMRDRDDNDWGTGSFDLGEAKDMARLLGPEAYIAVIENDVCIEEIEQEDLIEMTIKEIRALTGLTQVKFGEMYHIPRRTIEDWERGVRIPPEYVLELLERAVKEDFNINEE